MPAVTQQLLGHEACTCGRRHRHSLLTDCVFSTVHEPQLAVAIASHVSRWAACSLGINWHAQQAAGIESPNAGLRPCLGLASLSVTPMGSFVLASSLMHAYAGQASLARSSTYAAHSFLLVIRNYSDNRFTYLGQAKPLCLLPSCTKSCLMLPMGHAVWEVYGHLRLVPIQYSVGRQHVRMHVDLVHTTMAA